MTRMLSAAAALLLAAAAAPVLAQVAPPAAGAAQEGPRRSVLRAYGHDGHGKVPGMIGGAMSALSPEGRKILGDAMREAHGDGPDLVAEARRKVLELLDADRLDVAAVRRAMQEEQALVERRQRTRQEAMLGAYQKLSVRDRKAFATAMRAQTYRMEMIRRDAEDRVSRMRERRGRDVPQAARD